jgi:Ca2+-binding EF-hand superfamily protein
MNISAEQLENITKIFYQFDKNKNNTIDKKELKTLSAALNTTLSNAELLDFFKEFDNDKSGFITLEEFINYWNKE